MRKGAEYFFGVILIQIFYFLVNACVIIRRMLRFVWIFYICMIGNVREIYYSKNICVHWDSIRFVSSRNGNNIGFRKEKLSEFWNLINFETVTFYHFYEYRHLCSNLEVKIFRKSDKREKLDCIFLFFVSITLWSFFWSFWHVQIIRNARIYSSNLHAERNINWKY